MTATEGNSGMHTPVLEISDGSAAITRTPLTGKYHLIGRSADAQIRLDRHTVSRHHAEVFCDPFGRWWVRDLQSRNGVLVGGTRVAEHALRPGDRFQVGEFHLTFQVPSPLATTTATREAVVFGEGQAPRFSTLDETDRPRIGAAQISRLMRFERELLDIADPAQRLTALCRLMVENDLRGLSATALRVAKPVDSAEAQLLSSAQSPAGATGAGAPISRSVLRELARQGRPLMASNVASGTGLLQLSMAAEVMSIAVAACPLADGPTAMDCLYVVLPPQCAGAEWLAMVALAAEQYRLAESAWQARQREQFHMVIERELQAARQIQMRLVPRKPSVAGLDIAVGFEPCHWVGGDYVDVAATPDGRLFLAVADVCGKGLPAALVSATLCTTMRAAARAGMALPEAMTMIRRGLADSLPESSFVTMACLCVDPRTGAIELANAGHPPPLIVRPDGSLRQLPCGTDMPLGVADEPLCFHRDEIEKDELLALYTDGITELSNPSGEMLGMERFAADLAGIYRASAGAEASAVAASLSKKLDAFRAARLPDDDRTFLLARRV